MSTLKERGTPGPGGAAPACELQRRPLTRSEAERVVAQIRRSPKITGYSVAEWTGGRDTFVIVRTDTGELIGAVLVHHLPRNWCEIAVVFVLEEHRHRGHGRALLTGVLRTLRTSGKRQLLFFSDEIMGSLARDAGFAVHPDLDAYLRRHPRHRLVLRYVYPVLWLANVYRIRELRRKRRELNCSFEFQVAVRESGGTTP